MKGTSIVLTIVGYKSIQGVSIVRGLWAREISTWLGYTV